MKFCQLTVASASFVKIFLLHCVIVTVLGAIRYVLFCEYGLVESVIQTQAFEEYYTAEKFKIFCRKIYYAYRTSS